MAVAAACLLADPVAALDGQPGLHDPSTVIVENGKYYAGSVMQAVAGGKPGPAVIARGGNNTWAPDVIRAGDKYFLY